MVLDGVSSKYNGWWVSMRKDEAIYCMETYIGDNAYTGCFKCPYYGKKKIDDQTSVCMSNEAHRMAVEALKRDDPEVEFQKRFEKTTFCGYTAKELLLFADACKQQGISNDMLYDFCLNVESAYVYIVEKMQKEMKRKLS